MSNTIKIGVEVNTNLKPEIKDAEKFKSTLDAAAASAAKIGGTAGSRRVAAAAAPVGSQEIVQYGAMRGTAGATGASARDFANQAQGLGGLVRIYATYAANVFALGAAFRALSGAMDTSNMIEGLNQLGAVSGKSLGNVSKELVRVTNGAVSLREAMEATVKGSSSGMMSSDILRMGKVAQQASVALGVNMTDALSRISRGITKLEPELLDELGLFTKVDRSVQEYAKSVGKAESQLTDFERRQAFANAVLEEGERKFSAINIETNPYTQLAASIQNLMQQAMELVNKGLVPIVNILAASPVALGVAIAAIGTTIAKRTLPQLLDLKKNFDNFAKQGLAKATERKNEALSALLPDVSDVKRQAEARVNALYDTFESAADKYMARPGKKSQAVIDFIAAGEEATPAQRKQVENLMARTKAGGELNKIYKDLLSSSKDLTTAEQVYANASKEITRIYNTKGSLFTVQGQLQRQEFAALQSARSKDIVSITAQQAATKGLGQTFSQLWTTLKAVRKEQQISTQLTFVDKSGKQVTETIKTTVPALGIFRTAATGVAAGLAASAVATARFGGALLTYLPYLGLAAAGFTILNKWLSSNAKQLAKVSEANDTTSGSIKTLSDTLDLINKKSFLEQFSVQSLDAKSNSLNEFASGLNKLIDASIKADAAAGGWDKFIDSFKRLWGGDLQSQVTKGLLGGINEIFESQDLSAIENLRQTLAKSLQIPPESLQSFEDVSSLLKNIALNDPRLKDVGKSIEQLGKEAGITASRSRELKEAVQTATNSYRDYLNTFKISDPFSKLILDSISGLEKLDNRLKTGSIQENTQAIIENIDNILKSNMFGLEDNKQLAQFSTELANTNKQYQEQAKRLKELKQLREEIEQKPETYTQTITDIGTGEKTTISREDIITDIVTQTNEINLYLTQAADKFKDITDSINKVIPTSMERQLSMAAAKIGESIAKAGGQTAQSIYSQYKDVPELVKADTEAKLKQIEAEITLTDAIYKAITVQTELNASIQVSNAIEALKQKEAEGLDTTAAEQQLEAAKTFEKAITDLVGGKSLPEITSKLPKGSGIEGRLTEFAMTRAGTQAQLISLKDKAEQVKLEGRIAELQAKSVQNVQRILENEIKYNAEQQKSLELEIQSVGYADERAIKRKQELSAIEAQKQAELENEKSQVKYLQDLENVNALRKEGKNDAANALAIQAIFNKLTSDAATSQKLINSEKAIEINKEKELQSFYVARFTANSEIARIQEQARQTIEQQKIIQQENTLQDLQRLNANQALIISQQAQVNIAKEEAATRQEIFNLELSYVAKISELLQKRGPDTDRLIAQEKERFLQARTAAEELGRDKIARIKLVAEFDVSSFKVTEIFDNLKQAVQGLGETFGSLGGSIEKTITTYATFAANQQKLSQELKQFEENRIALADEGLDASNDLSEKYYKAESSKRKELISQELAGYQQTVGAAKGMFKEKTAAYKVLAATEKTLHIVRLAMEAKELFVKLTGLKLGVAAKVGAEATETSAEYAGLAARSPALITGIFGKITAQTGIAGPAIAAGIVAAIFGALAGRGGGGGVSVPTSAQRQEVAGTAMSYDASGQLVQTRMGVLGDTSAKSETITKSLEILADNSVEGLRYDNRMTRALEKLLDSIDQVAASIFKLSPALIGSTSALTKLTGIAVGSTGSSVNIPLIGGFLGSSKTTTQLNDSGIKLTGTFLDIAKAGETGSKAVRGFAEYLVTSSKKRLGGLGGSSTSTSTRFEEFNLPPQLIDQLSKAYQYGIDFLVMLGDMAGFEEQEIIKALGTVDISQLMSLKDLKGEQLAQAITSYVSGDIDKAAESIFTQYMRFVKVGESMGEALTRVLTNNKKVEQSLRNIGVGTVAETLEKTGVIITTAVKGQANVVEKGLREAAGSVSKIDSEIGVSFDPKMLKLAAVEITEGLIEIAGGIDKFLGNIQTFREKFMTEAERMAITREEVYAEINRLSTEDFPLIADAIAALGLSLDPNAGEGFLDTREEFAKVIELLGMLGISGLEASTGLLTVAEGFAEITPELKAVDLSKITDFIKDIKQQTIDVEKQLSRLGANAYEQAVWNIVDNLDNLMQKLRDMGGVTTANVQAIVDLTNAQLELLNAQNARKAAEIITTINADLSAQQLGELGRELTGIAQRARSYVMQLVELGQATEANIAAVRAWESTLMAAARAARLAAQDATYAELFATSKADALAAKFRKLGFSLPANIEQLKYLVDSIDTTTDAGIELRGALLGLGSEFQNLINVSSDALRSAYDARVQELEGARSQFEQFGESLKSFRQSLLTGALSPLTPAQRYAQTKSEFERVSALAASGDIRAIEQLESVSSAYLEASRGMYASSELYTQDFNQVLGVLDSTISITELQMQTAENTLAEVRAAVGQLIDISESTSGSQVALTGLGPKLEKAIADYTTAMSQNLSNVSYEVLQQELDAANAANAALGNIGSGIDSVDLSMQSLTGAVNAFTTKIDEYLAEAKAADEAAATTAGGQSASLETIAQTLRDRLVQPYTVRLETTPTSTPTLTTPTPSAWEEQYKQLFGFYPTPELNAAYSTTTPTASTTIPGYNYGDQYFGYDVGTNYITRDHVAMVHEGERIMPKADNTQLFETLNRLERTESNNMELQAELVELRKTVGELIQVVVQGAVVNADATNRNTTELAETIRSAIGTAVYTKKMQSRTSVI